MPVLNAVRTADDVLKVVRERNPTRQFTKNKAGTLIGLWDDELRRFVVVASLSITGEWVSLPYEILANGKPMTGKADWVVEEGMQ